jgi:putative membrane protein
MSKYTFTEEEKQAIEQAVKSLETRSCGEIVPYFVRSSHDYPEVPWRLAALSGFAMALLLAGMSYSWLLPFRIDVFWACIAVAALMLLGYFLPFIFPAIIRAMVPEDERLDHVKSRAKDAFLDEGVFNTEERVGILIFISKLEHEVLVLGDEGISKKVEPHEWQEVVNEVVGGIKRKQIGDGLVHAIAKCEGLLLAKGFVRKSTDTNELHDGLRIGE